MRYVLLVIGACSTNPWEVAGAPAVPPDAEFRAGRDDVYVWKCAVGERVVVRQTSSGCFGAHAPEIQRGPCGAPLAMEMPYLGENRADNLPVAKRWPDASATVLVYDSGDLPSGTRVALRKAVAEANTALDRAYAKQPKEAAHTGAWVTEATAHITGDETTGWSFTWDWHPTAGFAYSASVSVAPDGVVTVTNAEARFSAE